MIADLIEVIIHKIGKSFNPSFQIPSVWTSFKDGPPSCIHPVLSLLSEDRAKTVTASAAEAEEATHSF